MTRYFWQTAVAGLIVAVGVQAEGRAATTPTPFGTTLSNYNFQASDMLLDPTKPLLYVTVAGTKTLDVINTATLAVQASVPLTGSGGQMALSPDGSRLYIADGSANDALVVSTANLAQTATVPMPFAVTAIAAGNGNRLFVSGYNNFVAAQVDATTGTSAGPNLPIQFPYSGAMRTSPDHNTLYYGTYGSSPTTLSELNVTSAAAPKLLNSIAVGSNGKSLALSADGTLVSLASGAGYSSYDVPVFRASDLSLTGLCETGPYPGGVAFSPDDRVAYAATYGLNDAVTAYDTKSFQPLASFTVSNFPGQMTTDATGHELFVSSGNLSVYAVPEPATAGLLAATAVTLMSRRHRRLAGN